ncbi:MAG TPA: hypothetical protein VLA74_09270, partial [Nitrososphaeraceae archaeon]|nr:hypothetical protein [Nitrososphaeraceae archaeon]
MTTHDSNNIINKGTSFYFIPLQLGKKLQDEEIIHSFVKDPRTNSIILELNHKYDKTKVIVSINTKKWENFQKSIEETLKDKDIGISDKHIRLI